MFTSEPSLIQRIERMIAETPIIDPDTDLNTSNLSAGDMSGLLREPCLVSTLKSVGMAIADLEPGLDAKDRIYRVIPYLARIRNTAPAWCLFRIFRDLFDFHDPQLTESNASDLIDRIERNCADLAWGSSILQDRCKIRSFATSLEHSGGELPHGIGPILYSLDLDILLRPDLTEVHRNGPVLKHREEAYDRRLARLLGELPSSASQLRKLVHAWLDRYMAQPIRFARLSLPAGRVLTRPDPLHAVQVLSQAAAAKPLNGENVEELSRFVISKALDWLADHKVTLQIALGGHSHVDEEHHTSRFDAGWGESLAHTLRRYPSIQFDLLPETEPARLVALNLAANLPNVSITGAWRYDFTALAIADLIGRGIHVVPMGKLTGFSSGASSAEWTYGKFQLARKAIASAFARLVDGGYYEEDEIPPMLIQILHDTPRASYQT